LEVKNPGLIISLTPQHLVVIIRGKEQELAFTQAVTTILGQFYFTCNVPDVHAVSSSDILVLKLISVLVFILFSSQNFYFI